MKRPLLPLAKPNTIHMEAAGIVLLYYAVVGWGPDGLRWFGDLVDPNNYLE